ncbi:MAG: InlB B-repeat-containing protein [Acholeplasmatales bacterium]|nr:InlB B-repeat-containing protein [Acholeplasmatales bacterium]
MVKFFKKKFLLFIITTLALATAFTLMFFSSFNVYAASYNYGSGGFTLNSDNSISANFTVSDNNLSMRGWLLCLFSQDPGVSAKSKLSDSNDAHPYSYSKCAHYYFVSSTTQTGNISLTWAANSADQKNNWNANGGTSTDNNSLGKVIGSQNWYIVIGPRHYNTSWGSSGVGAGNDGYWENCDYYVGQKQTVMPSTSTSAVTISAGTGIKSVYLSTSSTATSGSASGTKFNDGTTVYGFAKLNKGYSKPSNASWTLVSGTANTENAIYRVGSKTAGSANFGTINATANVYNITYKDGGNTAFSGSHASGYPQTHTYGTATTLKTATKTGYDFGGWFSTSACSGSAITSLGATAYTGNITLYAKWTLKSEIQNVINKINAIGTVTYPGSNDAITGARNAYDTLSTSYQNLVSNYQTLVNAETTYYNKGKAYDFEEKVNNFGKVYFPSSKAKVLELIDTYEALTSTQLGFVSDDAKVKYGIIIGTYNAKETEYFINKIGDVDTTSKPKIDEALNHYNNLTLEEKELVSDDILGKLKDSQVDYVDALINDLGDVDSSDEIKAKLDEINTLIDALDEEQKSSIGEAEKEKLNEAEKDYVEALIDEIGSIDDINYSDDYNDKINKALDAYNNLTEEQKNDIPNKDELLNDKERYDDLAKVDDFISKIDNCGDNITYPGSSTDVEAMKDAYDNLTSEQKALIPLDRLDEFKDINDEYSVNECEYYIAQIDSTQPTDDAKDKIYQANEKYNNLTDEQKQMLSDEKLDDLKNDNIDYAKNMIDAIGEVDATDSSKDKIDAAQNAYNNLKDFGLDLPKENQKELNDAQVEYVSDLIDAIGEVEATPESKERIDKAQDALDELKDKELSVPRDKEKTLNNSQVEYVEDLIDAIGEVEATQDSKDKIDAAQDALADLELLGLIIPDDKKDELDSKEIEYVEELLNEIASIDYTDSTKDKIEEASKALEELKDKNLELSEENQAKLDNVNDSINEAQIGYVEALIEDAKNETDSEALKEKLDKAQDALDELKDKNLELSEENQEKLDDTKTALDETQIKYVDALIEAIGEVDATDSTKDKIEAAEKAIKDLEELGLEISDEKKDEIKDKNLDYVDALIEDINNSSDLTEQKEKLDKAQDAYEALKEKDLVLTEDDETRVNDTKNDLDESQIDYVNDLIEAIGIVDSTDEAKGKIEEAEKALKELKELDLELSEENQAKLDNVNDSFNDKNIQYVDALINDIDSATNLEEQKEKLDKAQDALDELNEKGLTLSKEDRDKLDNTTDNMNDAQVDYVNDLISDIENATNLDEQKDKVEKAQDALNELNEKGLDIPADTRADMEKEELDYLEALIKDIENATDLEEVKEKLDIAQDALETLQNKGIEVPTDLTDDLAESQIKYVEDMIAEIGTVEATLESKALIEAAEEAYQDLKDLGLELPIDKKDTLDEAEIKYVEEVFNEIGMVDSSDETKEKIEKAEKALAELKELGLELSDENQDKLNTVKDNINEAQIDYVDALIEDAKAETDLASQREKLDKAQEAFEELKDKNLELSADDQSKFDDTMNDLAESQIDYVNDLINEIGIVDSTDSSKEKIDEAFEALKNLEELGLELSGENTIKLNDVKNSINEAQIDYVDALILDAQNETDLESQKEKLDKAQDAYDALTIMGLELSAEDQTKLDTTKDNLDGAQVDYVEDLINAIGEVDATSTSKDKIEAAEDAIANLKELGLDISDEKKDEIKDKNLDYVDKVIADIENATDLDEQREKLDKAEEAYNELTNKGLELTEEDQTKLDNTKNTLDNAQVEYVTDLIDEIGEVERTPESKEKIEKAEEALSNLKDKGLDISEEKNNTLDKAQINYVEELFEAIGEVDSSKESKDKIEEAQKALDELKDKNLELSEENTDKLNTVNNNINEAQVDYVDALIDDINNATNLDEQKELVERAQEAYDELKDKNPDLSDETQAKLDTTKDNLDNAQIDYVKDMIEAIGDVDITPEAKDRIDEARDAYNNLQDLGLDIPSDIKDNLDNANLEYVSELIADIENSTNLDNQKDRLEKAQEAYDELKDKNLDLSEENNDKLNQIKDRIDESEIDYVKDLIADIDNATNLEDKKNKLDEAQKAYDELEDMDLVLSTDNENLSDELREALDTALVDYVNDLINDINESTELSDKNEKIELANEAIKELNDKNIELSDENQEKLNECTETLENEKVKLVEDLIADIENSSDLKDKNDKIKLAEAALSDLEDEGLTISDDKKNDLVEAEISYVADLIEDIKNTTSIEDTKERLEKAEKAYEELKDKGLVLTDENQELLDNTKNLLDGAEIDYVNDLIGDIVNANDLEEEKEKLDKAQDAIKELNNKDLDLSEDNQTKLDTANDYIDKAQIDYVNDLVVDIENTTDLDEKKEKLDKAQDAFEALKDMNLDLSDENQTKINDLTDAIENVHVEYVEDVLEAIGTVDSTDSTKEKLEDLEQALKDLEELGLELSEENATKLDQITDSLKDKEIDYVDALINDAKAEADLDLQKEKLDKAQDAYEALAEKGLDLTTEEQARLDITKENLDDAQVDYVKDLIDEIGVVDTTDESKEKIDKAEAALKDLEELGLELPADDKNQLNEAQVEYVEELINEASAEADLDLQKEKLDKAQEALEELKNKNLELSTLNQEKLDNTSDALDDAQVDYVKDLIDNIGTVDTTDESKEKIDKAEAALKDLEELGLDIPTEDKDKLNEAQVEYVEELINEASAETDSEAQKEKLEKAQEALKELNDKGIELSEENQQKLDNTTETLNNTEIDRVKDLIDAIGEVEGTTESKEKIDKAEEALKALEELGLAIPEEDKNKLNAAQVEYVEELVNDAKGEVVLDIQKEKLDKAQEALKDLEDLGLELPTDKKEELDNAQIEYVSDLIDAIGTVDATPESKEKIDKAQDALNDLEDLGLALPTDKKEDLADAQVDYVEELISDIGQVEATDESKAKIDEAQKALEELKDLGLDVSADSKEELDGAQIDYVEELLEEIGTVEGTAESKEKIEKAQEALKDLEDLGLELSNENQEILDGIKDSINEAQIDYVDKVIADINNATDLASQKEKLEKAQEALDELKAKDLDLSDEDKAKFDNTVNSLDNAQADYVKDMIDAIGEIDASDESKDKIDAAIEAYNNLTAEQKALIDADKVEELSNTESNHVEALIDDIGDVEYKPESKDKLDKAKDAYDNLTEEQKGQVSSEELEKLLDAIEKYDNLEEVQELLDAIDNFGIVAYPSSEDKLNDLNDIYNDLTEEQKALIPADKLNQFNDINDDYLVYECEYQILALGDIKKGNLDKDKIDLANEKYQELTEEQKAKVDSDMVNDLNNANIEYVEKLINNIGKVKGTDSTKDRIDEAQKALDELNELGLDVSNSKEDKLDRAQVNYVDALIDLIGEVEDTEESKGKIEKAYEALKELKDALKDSPKVDLLEESAKRYEDLHEANITIDLIDLIGEIENTNESREKINDALDYYNSLTEDQKAIIPQSTVKTLTDDKAAFDAIDKINQIGELKYEENSKSKMDEARALYNTLTDDQKALVVNYNTLTKDETDYQAVTAVITEIDNIGNITYNDESIEKIESARQAKESLTEDQKRFFPDSSEDKLADYEETIVVLEMIYDIGSVEYTHETDEKVEGAKRAYDELTPEQKELINDADLEKLTTAVNDYNNQKRNFTFLLIVLLSISSFALAGGIFYLVSIFKNKKNGIVKAKSVMPFGILILASHFTDSAFIILYVIAALAVITWIVIGVLVLINKKKNKKS